MGKAQALIHATPLAQLLNVSSPLRFIECRVSSLFHSFSHRAEVQHIAPEPSANGNWASNALFKSPAASGRDWTMPGLQWWGCAASLSRTAGELLIQQHQPGVCRLGRSLALIRVGGPLRCPQRWLLHQTASSHTAAVDEAAAQLSCWNCGAWHGSSPFFCPGCHAIQPADQDADFFAVMGL
jgi:hypothetical protein